MRSKLYSLPGYCVSPRAWACISLLLLPMMASAFDALLQGQSEDSSEWIDGNLQDWEELDYIPCRVFMEGGAIANKVLTVQFDHSAGRIPGIQNLTSFDTSDNVVITSGPTLLAPPTEDIWSYTFTINKTDGDDGYVKFKARLAAGAHLNVGSSLALKGSSSAGVLQIHKPGPGDGVPDLAVVKTGPATAAPGEIITYTLHCRNKSSAVNSSDGVQVSDILPGEVTYVADSATDGGTLVGNTLTWDLGSLDEGEDETVSYQVRVNSNLSFGDQFSNFAQIFSEEDDEDYSDNWSSVTTTINFNFAPVANNDAYSVDENSTLNVAVSGVLANDTDAEGDPLSAILLFGVTHGTLAFNANGSFTYSPEANYNGADSFAYVAGDGNGYSDVATATIIVNPVNDAPVAQDDAYNVNEDSPLSITEPGVLTNDTDLEGDSLMALLLSGPAHGTLTLNPNGSFLYMPAANYHGPDSFTYNANDGSSNSGAATVSITVNPRNDPPVANNDAYSVNEDRVLSVAASGVLANDMDVDGNPLTAILVSGAAHGAVNLLANGSFVYTPASNYNGTDSFTYRANDGSADSGLATVTITISPGNDAPVANNDNYSTDEDQPLTVNAPGILANDTDIDGDSLEAAMLAGPSHGTLTLNLNGSFIYRPATNYAGNDSFTYEVDDGQLESGVATVNLTIRAVNDAPVANQDSYTTTEDLALTIGAPGVLANDTDTDGDRLEALMVTEPAHGTLILNLNGSFTYTPNANYQGTDRFTYRATDGRLESAVTTVNITITSLNDAPAAGNDSYTVSEDTTLSVAAPGVLGNDTDVDGDALLAVLVSQPFHGKLTLSANGSFLYEPNTNYNGADTFIYKANDGAADSTIAIVSISVTPVNDVPVSANDAYNTHEDMPLNIAGPGVLANDSDVESSFLMAVLVSNPSHGTLALHADGSFTYTPALNYNGPDSFTYKANDGSADSEVATVALTVAPVNDAPSFAKGPNQLVQSRSGGTSAQTVPNWATAISPGPADETGQTFAFILSNDNASLFSVQPAISSAGTLSYTPAAGAFGAATVTVVLRDNGGTENGGTDTSAAQTFAITVNAPPVVSIVTPTNGAFYIAPANISVVAEANDPDGSVTNITLLQGTNLLASLDATPYYTIWTNVPAGQYQFSARATDNAGATGQSSLVNVTVLERPPILIVTPMHVNRQTGLYEHTVRVVNPTAYPYDAVRVLIRNLPAGTLVYNASGQTNGVPYVQSNLPVSPGGSVDFKIEYYANRALEPALEAQLVSVNPPPNPTGTFQHVSRALRLSNGTFLIEFNSLLNRTYYVQYTKDLAGWKTVTPTLTGTGTRIQWIDNGPPKTESDPASELCRLYRVLMLP